MGTPFTAVYERFLDKITDDLYIELTPEDTIKDLQHMLISALPGFEYPRVNLYDYTIDVQELDEEDVKACDFILGLIWHEMSEADGSDACEPGAHPRVKVEKSYFNVELTPEEINILAILMMCNWVQRQLTSIENTRMKYSGADFKMTSQANHLSKLQSLLSECHRQSHHMQRLYKRREIEPEDSVYRSTWYWFGDHSATK